MLLLDIILTISHESRWNSDNFSSIKFWSSEWEHIRYSTISIVSTVRAREIQKNNYYNSIHNTSRALKDYKKWVFEVWSECKYAYSLCFEVLNYLYFSLSHKHILWVWSFINISIHNCALISKINDMSASQKHFILPKRNYLFSSLTKFVQLLFRAFE